MKISPARLAAMDLLYDDRWLHSDDWDQLIETQFLEFKLSQSRDRRLFSHLVAGCVRLQGRLDARLQRLCRRDHFDPVVLTSLRLALFQMEEMDRQPSHAVFSDSVEWVKKRRGQRLAGWVNAQLRNWQRSGVPGTDPDPQREPLRHAVEWLSYPPWLAERWLAEYGPEVALPLMASMNRHQGTCFRWNGLRSGRDQFLAQIGSRVDDLVELSGLPGGFRIKGGWPEIIRPALEQGKISVQDETAQRVSPLLRPEKGQTIADLCSAPGGKGCHLAELMNNQGRIFAVDKSGERVKKVIANARRLGLNSVEPEVGDLLKIPGRPCHGVLLDAPCSALGVLAGNPDARWRKSSEQILQLQGLQRELLTAAAGWVRPGGRLVYSVCTFTPEETSDQVSWFTGAQPEFEVEPMGEDELPARLIQPTGEMLILPHLEQGTGAYAVRFRRRER
jgi:16S rRNA (cytosine967-C5)-methyltransferase